jgi:hypothetical protein
MKKISIILIGVALLASGLFLLKRKSTNTTASIVAPVVSATPQGIENDPRYIALIQSLPKFSDYPATVSHIPPKPKVNHKSNPMGMEFYSLTESWASQSQSYTMGGHYLMDRYGTGNPDVLIVDGLTGQVRGAYGGISFEAVASSSLVIFDPFYTGDTDNPSCFSSTSSGDYDQCYGGMGGNPRYAVWTGEYFKTICEPVVRNWKVISCGGPDGKKPDTFDGSQKVDWMGTVVATMTYGRLRIKLDDVVGQRKLGFSEFVAEPYDVVEDGGLRYSPLTRDIQVGDLVSIIGYLEAFDPINQDVPWVLIDGQAGVFTGIQKYNK